MGMRRLVRRGSAIGAVALLVAGCTTRVTDANGESTAPSVSANGRYIAFASKASNLVPGETTAGQTSFCGTAGRRRSRA